MSDEARAYLDKALDVMQENSFRRREVDWAAVQRVALEAARGAQDTIDTYEGIRAALKLIGDGHSFLALSAAQQQAETRRARAGVSFTPAQSNAPLSSFAGRGTSGSVDSTQNRKIAKIVVPSFAGQDGNAFAVRMQNLIAQLTEQRPCGWIVDLRGNGGGNMWPMLAGVGPILGEGVVGGYVSSSGGKTSWFYEEGKAGTRVTGQPDTVHLEVQAPVASTGVALPVAVLQDRGTGSSGEAISIAFRGRPGTRFFGSKSYGVANSTFPFPLTDGAQLYLVVAVDVDRDGKRYDDGVVPDETIPDGPGSAERDRVSDAAMRWITNQTACSAN